MAMVKLAIKPKELYVKLCMLLATRPKGVVSQNSSFITLSATELKVAREEGAWEKWGSQISKFQVLPRIHTCCDSVGL
jgi:hypothetical protein